MAALTKIAISVTVRDFVITICDHKGYQEPNNKYFQTFKILYKQIKMADLAKNVISVLGRDRAKQTKILDHKGYKSQKTNIFKNS